MGRTMGRAEPYVRVAVILVPFVLTVSGLVYVQAGVFSQFSLQNAGAIDRVPLSGVTRLAAATASTNSLPGALPAVMPRPAPRPWRVLAPSAATDPVLQTLAAAFSGPRGASIPFPADNPTPLADSTRQQLLALAKAVRAELSTNGASTSSSPPDLAEMVVQALLQDQSLAYLDTRLNAAARQGVITIPAGFADPDGRIDTAGLLTAIARAAAMPPPDPSASPTTRTGPVGIYTVREGDSLGSIAKAIYGDGARFDVIFAANRATLASPDAIRVGQRLRIPPLARN